MRFLSPLLALFPLAHEALTAVDEAIGRADDDINGRMDGVAWGLRAQATQGFNDLGARIAALEAQGTGSAPPAEPPVGPGPDLGASTMAPTPAGMAWLVIPDTADPQPGELPGARCPAFTPVPRVVPPGFVLALVPAGYTPPSA